MLNSRKLQNNAIYFQHNILHYFCFHFPKGRLLVRRKIENNTYAAKLEKKLHARSGASRSLEVCNVGKYSLLLRKDSTTLKKG